MPPASERKWIHHGSIALTALRRVEGSRRSEIVGQITQKLRLHTQIEEEILYPGGKSVDSELVLECFEEHHMVKILLEEIEQTQPSTSATWPS